MCTIDHQKKSDIVGLVIQNRKELRLLSGCSRLSVAAALLIGLLQLGLKAIFAGFYFWDVILTVVFHLILGLVFRWCFGLLLGNRVSKDLTERMDEELTVAGDTILYAFRIRYYMPESDRVVIRIPVRGVHKVDYDQKTEKLEFRGIISSGVIKNYTGLHQYGAEDTVLNQLVIYDYFHPSLRSILESCGLL